MTLPRHTRVWPTTAGYAALMSAASDTVTREAIELWSAHVWPLIVRRPLEGESRPAHSIAVGLPLPPSLGKRRLQLALPIDRIAAHAPPLALDDVVDRIDSAVALALAGLRSAAARARIVLRVFGSVAWQAETSLDYVNRDSDVDLLAAPKTRVELAATLSLLDRAQGNAALPLDGEIVFPDGDAIAWREWMQIGDKPVLVKNLTRVALLDRRELESKLDQRLSRMSAEGPSRGARPPKGGRSRSDFGGAI